MKWNLTLLAALAALAACNHTDLRGTSERLNPTIKKSFVQDDYPTTSTVHIQGHRGEPGVADFEQGEWGALDVLVVVDNSGSMAEEQANLSTKLEPLLSHVEKADWRISVVTTDPSIFSGGCQRELILKTDADAKGKFQAAVKAGTGGTGVERHFLQAVNGLKCRGGDWLRPASTLVVLFVTDEDNCAIDDTQGYGCAGEPDLDGSYLTDYLSSIRQLGRDAKIYGLYWKPQDPTCTTALVQASKVAAVVERGGGKDASGSICDADYTTTLKAISEDVAQVLKYEFDLEHTPDDGTLKILVDGAEWTKYTVAGRQVKFTEAPPFGAKVEVSYRHGQAGNLDTAFPVDKAPVDGTFEVAVDGDPVPAGEYEWNPATRRLELKTPPGERAEIKIVYKEKVVLKDTFDIGTDVDPKTLRALVDDQPAKVAKYDVATGLATLATPPPAKAKVVFSFKGKP